MRVSVLSMFVAAVLASGCGDDGPLRSARGVDPAWGPASNQLFSPSGEGGGLVGDWVVCEDLGCVQLGRQGARFTADGRVIPLERIDLRGSNVVAYCLHEDEAARYSYSGTTLVMTEPGDDDEMTYRMTVEGDYARLTGPDVGTIALLRIDPPNALGPCGTSTPLPEVPVEPPPLVTRDAGV
ncbi:hypothetical protein L6R52_05125 [Myxococcota bacterium]|nr:hypothetical protein [Myxococcota bacterium]